MKQTDLSSSVQAILEKSKQREITKKTIINIMKRILVAVTNQDEEIMDNLVEQYGENAIFETMQVMAENGALKPADPN